MPGIRHLDRDTHQMHLHMATTSNPPTRQLPSGLAIKLRIPHNREAIQLRIHPRPVPIPLNPIQATRQPQTPLILAKILTIHHRIRAILDKELPEATLRLRILPLIPQWVDSDPVPVPIPLKPIPRIRLLLWEVMVVAKCRWEDSEVVRVVVVASRCQVDRALHTHQRQRQACNPVVAILLWDTSKSISNSIISTITVHPRLSRR